MKSCRVCGTLKPVSAYNKKASSKDGFRTDCRDCQKEYHRKRYAANPERHKEIVRKNQRIYTAKQHGMGAEDLAALYDSENHSCAICGISEVDYGKYLAIDHCHTSGKVRGLLCTGCNTGLGNFKDNPEFLAKAITYLKERQ